MSWLTQFWGWLNRSAESRQRGPDGKFNEPEKNDFCQAKAILAVEQSRLAEELERIFQAYDEKVKDLALRVRNLPAGAADAEIARLRVLQQDLQSVVGRLDAAAKSRQDLEQEMLYWQKRLDGLPCDRDKARRQTEILRSELAIRAPEEDLRWSMPAVVQAGSGIRQPFVFAIDDEPAVPAEDGGNHPELSADIPDYDYWPSAENLVAAIRDATHEAERWHAIPIEDCDEEAVLQVRHVKNLNAWLKRVDRRNGTTRDRLKLAISLRGYR